MRILHANPVNYADPLRESPAEKVEKIEKPPQEASSPDGKYAVEHTYNDIPADFDADYNRLKEEQIIDALSHQGGGNFSLKDAVEQTGARSVVMRGVFRLLHQKSASDANRFWKGMGYTHPPYTPGTKVNEVVLAENNKFVRVYDGVHSYMKGGWVMRESAINGLTAQQIQEKFALPYEPKYVADVEIEAGSKMRTGVANGLFGHEGGGIQFDLMGQRIGQFANERPLE